MPNAEGLIVKIQRNILFRSLARCTRLLGTLLMRTLTKLFKFVHHRFITYMNYFHHVVLIALVYVFQGELTTSYCQRLSRICLSHHEESAPIARSQKTICRTARYSSPNSTSQRWRAAGEQDHIQSSVLADDWRKEKNYSLFHSWWRNYQWCTSQMAMLSWPTAGPRGYMPYVESIALCCVLGSQSSLVIWKRRRNTL